MIFYLYLVLLIVFTALGQVFYKNYYRSQLEINLFLGIAFFGLTPLLGYLALRGLSLDFYCMMSALIIVLVQLLSRWILKEKLKKKEKFGIMMIVIGLLIYGI